MLVSGEDADVPFAPWSLRYSGHQFGVWAGQLGDGRAISIRVFSLFFPCSYISLHPNRARRRDAAPFRPQNYV
jgi:hypothetical protein